MANLVPRDPTISQELRQWLNLLAQQVDGLLNPDVTPVAPLDASYVTLGTNATLTSERVLTAGTGISFTDGGAGNPLTINNTFASITNVGSVAATSGTTASITNIPACKLLLVAYSGISHDNGANQNLTFALSTNNGSSYGTPAGMFSTALAAGVSGSGILQIMRMDQTSNFIFQSSFLAQVLGGVETTTSGTVNAIQFAWSAGNFDVGTGVFHAYCI